MGLYLKTSGGWNPRRGSLSPAQEEGVGIRACRDPGRGHRYTLETHCYSKESNFTCMHTKNEICVDEHSEKKHRLKKFKIEVLKYLQC